MLQCPGDEFLLDLAAGSLGPSELERADTHLDSCEECRGVVAELTYADSGEATLSPGAQIDRFVIRDVLGRGAMGTVYRAFDPQLEREIALKVLVADLPTSASLTREAIAMAKLSHVNVVSVFDAGTAGGTRFIAMELVRGQSLRDWLSQSQRTWREIRDVFVHAAKGLAAAHQAGIIHRDIKPDNILVGDNGDVKVGDFGLALEHSKTGKSSAGTPAYMAPEQIRGESATARSDQYSLCLALDEALRGERPKRDTALELPSGAAPRWLARALERGLEPKPSDRFEDLDALIAALGRDRKPSGVRVVTAIALTALLGAGGLFLAMDGRHAATELCTRGPALVGEIWNADRGAELRARLESSDAAHVRESAPSVIRSLDAWALGWAASHRSVCLASNADVAPPPAVVATRLSCLDRRLRATSAFVLELENGGREALRAAGHAVHELRASADCVTATDRVNPPTQQQAKALEPIERALARAQAFLALGSFSKARVEAEPTLEAAKAVGFSPRTAEVALVLAKAAAASDDFSTADAAAKDALRHASTAQSDTLIAEALIAEAAIAGELGRAAEAVERIAQARDAVLNVGPPRSPRLEAELAIVSGLALTALGELEPAHEALEAGLDVTPIEKRARLLTALGDVARLRGSSSKALALHRDALALNKTRLGANHPAVATSLHNIAGILRASGELDEALARYRESLELKRAAFGAEHSDVAITRNSIALVHLENRELLRARTELELARRILATTGHSALASVDENLAVLARLEKEDAAKTKPRVKPAPSKPDPSDLDGTSYAPNKPWQPGR